jgi:hypothetical protein
MSFIFLNLVDIRLKMSIFGAIPQMMLSPLVVPE